MKALGIFVISVLGISGSVMAGPGVTNELAVTNDLMRVRVTAICSSTNTSGGLSNQFMSNRNFIADCASDMGLTNLTGLSLVYNRTNQALEVVSRTNGTLVCTALSFDGGLSITNTNNTLFLLSSLGPTRRAVGRYQLLRGSPMVRQTR